MPLARELAKGGIKLLKNAKSAAKQTKATPKPPAVPKKKKDAMPRKPDPAIEREREARWAREKEARIRQERYQAQQNSKELWKYKEAESAKKATKARRVETTKNIAKGTGKAAAGATVSFGLMETATEGNFSKEVFGRKDKPTKASPKTRRAGKPMKGTK